MARVQEDLLGEAVLAGLPLVDLLLDGAGKDQAVDDDVPVLTDAPGPLACLQVCHGVPVGVEEHHSVGPDDIQAHTADARSQDHREVFRVGIELLDGADTLVHGHLDVQRQVAIALEVHPVLDDLAHHLGLHEDEDAVALGAPLLHDLRKDLELARPLGAPHRLGYGLAALLADEEVGVVAELSEAVDGEGGLARVLRAALARL
mmetsp:Transcript_67237/g.216953  ORF Transcript_67237/g.216953 Transcript_67237/m.216953 type:complete len:204 (+) Transcript_67237:898-1509(+)